MSTWCHNCGVLIDRLVDLTKRRGSNPSCQLDFIDAILFSVQLVQWRLFEQALLVIGCTKYLGRCMHGMPELRLAAGFLRLLVLSKLSARFLHTVHCL